MFRWKTATATVAASALTLTACGGGEEGSNGQESETLVLGSLSAPNSFDPAAGEWGNRSAFYQAAYDTLLRAEPDGTLVPMLADSWEYNDEETVLTLELRSDVTFIDGSDMTAEVVIANLERFQEGTAPGAPYLQSVESMTATGEHTVELELSEPDPALLDYLALEAGLIASGEALENEDLAVSPVGSGPYILDEEVTVSDSAYVFDANPDYWAPELQHYDQITIRLIADNTAAVNAIRAGEADAVKLEGTSSIREVESVDGWSVLSDPLNFAGLFIWDRGGEDTEALGDVRVRQALNHAFDRDALIEAVQDGYGETTTQPFAPRSDAFEAALDERYPYDPEQAQELLAEAGYSDGFELVLPSSSGLGTTVFDLMRQQLEDVGITVVYEDLAPNNFIDELLAPNYSASYMILEQNDDWQLMNFMLTPSATWNPYGYEDSQVTELIAEYRAEPDERGAIAAELNEYIVEEAWFAPWYLVPNTFAVSDSTNVEMQAGNAFPSLYSFSPE